MERQISYLRQKGARRWASSPVLGKVIETIFICIAITEGNEVCEPRGIPCRAAGAAHKVRGRCLQICRARFSARIELGVGMGKSLQGIGAREAKGKGQGEGEMHDERCCDTVEK